MESESLGEKLVFNVLQENINGCYRFLEMEREQLTELQSNPKQLSKHRSILKFLLRIMRILHAEVSDPDYPDRTVAPEIAAVIWKLNESWERLHDPMPDAEAEKILSQCFPGHGS